MSDPNPPRYSFDERLTDEQRRQWDEAQHESQQGGRGERMQMEGAAGVLGIVLLFAGVLIFMLYGCFFPLVALVTIVVAYLVSTLFDALVPNVGWMAHFLVLLAPSYAAFALMRQVEASLEASPIYRIVRHVLRLVVTGVVANFSATFVLEFHNLERGLPVDESFGPARIGIIAGALAIVHFVGRWYDGRITAALRPASRAPAGATAAPIDANSASVAAAKPRRRIRIPGVDRAPPAVQRGLGLLTLAGAVFGAFLGYAGFETLPATAVGLLAGSIGGALLMFVCWLVTRPASALFERKPVLWPLFIGAVVGLGIAWRLAFVDQASIASYLLPGMLGGVAVFTVPYLGYALVRRLFAAAA